MLITHAAFTLQAFRTTGCNILPPLRSLTAWLQASIANALANAQANIVLPAFAQSFFADGKMIQV